MSIAKQGQVKVIGLHKKAWRRGTLKRYLGNGGAKLSFLVRATHDILPSPQNLKQWYGEDLLLTTSSNIKTHLARMLYEPCPGLVYCTWQHNKVLQQLASVLEQKQATINALSRTFSKHSHHSHPILVSRTTKCDMLS